MAPEMTPAERARLEALRNHPDPDTAFLAEMLHRIVGQLEGEDRYAEKQGER